MIELLRVDAISAELLRVQVVGRKKLDWIYGEYADGAPATASVRPPSDE